MKHGVLFALLGLAQLYLAWAAGPVGVLWAWSALSFLLVAAGYMWIGPSLFGKQPNGKLPLWRVVLLLPYLLMSWGLWHLQILLTREPCCHEVAPGMWLGRRPYLKELPPGVTRVIDLTAEFAAAKGIAQRSGYLCIPTLDAQPIDLAQLKELLATLRPAEAVYIHCASGHGRSAMCAAALLISRGLADDVDAAERMLKSVRLGVGLSGEQRQALATFTPELKATV